jgi:1-hydroxycarotenoid 3,4-desaturase
MSGKTVVIGAGIGGLTAALLLAQAGMDVTVCEAAAAPGGKLRELDVGGAKIDAGPTVFTLRPIFETVFAEAGARLEDHLTLERLDILARHAWEDGARLDLFADAARNIEAIGAFAGPAAARGYEKFSLRAKQVFETLDAGFMQAPQPGLMGLVRNVGAKRGGGLLNLSPFASLWDEVGKYFANPKLQQLFGRYATYCGSSPFTAPATLMLIAHAEQLGVWRITGGMHRLAVALADLAAARGATFRYRAAVTDITAAGGRVTGVTLADGEVIAADSVIANVDLAALDAGRCGPAAAQAVAGMMKGAARSLSAVTWAITGTAAGLALAHHNVFFSRNYPAEFVAIGNGQLPPDPTIYLCAPAEQKFFCLVNAPPQGDENRPQEAEMQACLARTLDKFKRCGLSLTPEAMVSTGPPQFATMFPATGGALYGRALEGWRDSFARPGSGTRLPGLYLAGGSVHPGPGLPMAAMSGRLAARRLLADSASTNPSRPAAMPGGMSTRSRKTAKTR